MSGVSHSGLIEARDVIPGTGQYGSRMIAVKRLRVCGDRYSLSISAKVFQPV